MKVKIYDDYDHLSRGAALQVVALVRQRPDATLVLPTGQTPVGMYRELVALVRRGACDLSRARVFALDELWPVPGGSDATFAAFLRHHLVDQVPVGAFAALRADAPDPDQECARYGAAVRAAGVDLAVLGLGLNGHIGCNEPGVDPGTDCLWVNLTEASRQAVRGYFPNLEPPRHGLTLGLGLLLEARSVLLLAAGLEKAAIVARALTGPVTPELPASLLRRHPRVTFLLDRAAARLL